jgi:hypothetical protein
MVKKIGPGACFGEIALITKEARNATITASSNVMAGGKLFKNKFELNHMNLYNLVDFRSLFTLCYSKTEQDICKHTRCNFASKRKKDNFTYIQYTYIQFFVF